MRTCHWFRHAKYESSDVSFECSNEWTGVYGYRREPVPYELAEEIVRELKLDVVILDLGEISSIRRYVNGSWDFTAMARPSDFARERGLPTPWADDQQPRIRPSRVAVVIPGAKADEITGLGVAKETVLAMPNAVIVLGDVSRVVRERPKTVVSRFLDDGQFSVSVLDGKTLRQFPTSRVAGVPPLESIAGETEPRAIVRALGIPEDWMFPPEDN